MDNEWTEIKTVAEAFRHLAEREESGDEYEYEYEGRDRETEEWENYGILKHPSNSTRKKLVFHFVHRSMYQCRYRIKSALLLQREINVEIMNENKRLLEKTEIQEKIIEKLKSALTDDELIHLGIW